MHPEWSIKLEKLYINTTNANQGQKWPSLKCRDSRCSCFMGGGGALEQPNKGIKYVKTVSPHLGSFLCR